MSTKGDLLRKRTQNLQQEIAQGGGQDDMLDEIARKDGVYAEKEASVPEADKETAAIEGSPVKAESTPNIDNKETLDKTATERAEELPIDEPKSEVITMHKEVIPEDKKNLTSTKSFSIDRETIEEFEAVVKLMQESGAKIDGRAVTESSLIRLAIKDEVARLERKNGKEFRQTINEMLARSSEKKSFSL